MKKANPSPLAAQAPSVKKRKRSPLILSGILLVVVSLGLLLAVQVRLYDGAEHCRQILAQMEQVLPEATPGTPAVGTDPTMPVLELEGRNYVAIVDVPDFSLTLPVADQWDGAQAYLSPARFFGSAYDGTLVIGGVDDLQQFGFCDRIDTGAVIRVTDMTGSRFTYTVSAVERSDHAEEQWLTEADWDLTLFCHDMYALEYVAVRCRLTPG